MLGNTLLDTVVFIVVQAVVVALMAFVIYHDVKHRRIPNWVLVILLGLRLVLLALVEGGILALECWSLSQGFWQLVYALFWALFLEAGNLILKKVTHYPDDSVGLGDVKLVFVMLLLVPNNLGGLYVLSSTLLALVWSVIRWLRTGDNTFPFGPSWVIGYYITLAYLLAASFIPEIAILL